jgi:hypothetical protein
MMPGLERRRVDPVIAVHGGIYGLPPAQADGRRHDQSFLFVSILSSV